ncbi:MAG: secondary thiamine-phosphate synthase enzyme YjbQ [Thermoplasmata archaeon]
MKGEKIEIMTDGELDFINISDKIEEIISKLNVKNGMCIIFLKSTTSAIIINEDDDNLIEDFRELLRRLVPENIVYRHDTTWGDGNGRSHLRSMMLRNQACIPVINGKLALGTWQSIFLVELDVRPRKREIIVAVMEE